MRIKTDKKNKKEISPDLVENLNIGVYRNTGGPHGKFLQANPAIAKMFGYRSVKEFMKASVTSLYQNPKDRQQFFSKVSKNGSVKDEELFLKKKDGTPIVALCTAHIHYAKDGSIEWIDGVIEDITERKRIEENLRKANNFNQTMMDTIPFGVDIVDMKGNVLFISKRFRSMVRIANPIGKKCWDLYRDDKEQCADCPLKNGIEIGKTRSIEAHGCFNGKTFYITHTGMVYNEKKAILEIFQDITALKRSQEKVLHLSQAVEQNPACIMITDTNGNIEYVNPKFCALTGYTKEEAIGKNPRILKSGKQPAEVYKKLWSDIIAGREWQGEFHNKKKNGEKYWEFASISPIKDTKGKITHFLAVKEDITKQKEAEQEVKNANKRLEEQAWGLQKTNDALRLLYKELELKNKKLRQLDKLKSEFVSTVSHELRTPLAITKEGISLILDRITGDVNDKQEKILITAKNNIDRLARIINDLLDISRIESGKLELKRKVVNIIDVVRSVQSFFEPKIKSNGLKFKVDLPAKSIEVDIDPDRISQTFTNLIGNALKFTKQGHIGISVREKKNEVECSVSDTGIGIAPDELEKVFDKFHQVGRTAGPGDKGTGLGLSITKNIVEMHGGRLWVESETGKGSTFFFTVPEYKSPEENCNFLINESIKDLSVEKEEFLSIAVIQINNIKEIKNSLGPEAVKKIMSMLKNIISDCITRKEDIIAGSYSGKFSIILPNTDIKG